MDDRMLLVSLVTLAGAGASIGLTRLVHVLIYHHHHHHEKEPDEGRHLVQGAVGLIVAVAATIATPVLLEARVLTLTPADGYLLPLATVGGIVTAQGFLRSGLAPSLLGDIWPIAGAVPFNAFIAATISVCVVVPMLAFLALPGLLFELPDIAWVVGGATLLAFGVVLNLRRIARDLPFAHADLRFRRAASDFVLWLGAWSMLLVLSSAVTWTTVWTWLQRPQLVGGPALGWAVVLAVLSVLALTVTLVAVVASFRVALQLRTHIHRVARRAAAAAVSG